MYDRCRHHGNSPHSEMKSIARRVVYAVSECSAGIAAGRCAQRIDQPLRETLSLSMAELAQSCHGLLPPNPCARK